MNEEIKELFSNAKNKKKILEYAMDIRKFEIDLYWRRATYFWAFIAVIFAGYFAIVAADKIPDVDKLMYQTFLGCVGFVFSTVWYFVNRGSKFWQLNWESHVDIHEDEFIGPLMKTTLYKDQYPFCKLSGPFAFSVSKLNILLSLYVTVLWLILVARSTYMFFYDNSGSSNKFFLIVFLVISILTTILLFYKGRSTEKFELRQFVLRTYKSILIDKNNSNVG